MHLRMHLVRAFVIVHPMLHDAHFSAPFTGQPAPVSATPLLQVQVFAGNARHKSKIKSILIFFVCTRWQLANTHQCIWSCPGSTSNQLCTTRISRCHPCDTTRRLAGHRSCTCTNSLPSRTNGHAEKWRNEDVTTPHMRCSVGRKYARTIALGAALICFSAVQCPTRLTRLALFDSVHGTIRAGLRHAIVARARIALQPQHTQIIFASCEFARYIRNACMHVRIHSVPMLLRVHPVLHDLHFAAPFEGQYAAVCATPSSHEHLFTIGRNVCACLHNINFLCLLTHEHTYMRIWFPHR